MIPGIGSVASYANAVWYVAEDDYANAGLSAVSMIPGVGTAVKGGTLAVKATATAVKVAPKAAKAVSGLVKAAPKAISAVSQTVSNTASALVVGGKKAVNAARSASSSVNKATQPVKKTTGTTQKATSGKATSTASSPSEGAPSATLGTKKSSSSTAAVGKRWKVGNPIDQPTAAGNDPAWSTVRARHWKNEAYYHAELYSEDNLARMRKGKAAKDPDLGVSYELHHEVPVRDGGGNNIENLTQLTPWQHDAVDEFRNYNGPVPEGWDAETWLLENGA